MTPDEESQELASRTIESLAARLESAASRFEEKADSEYGRGIVAGIRLAAKMMRAENDLGKP